MFLSCVYLLSACSGWKKDRERESGCSRPAEETKRQTDTEHRGAAAGEEEASVETPQLFYHTRKHTLLNHAPEGFPPTSNESGNSVWLQASKIVPNERNVEKFQKVE